MIRLEKGTKKERWVRDIIMGRKEINIGKVGKRAK